LIVRPMRRIVPVAVPLAVHRLPGVGRLIQCLARGDGSSCRDRIPARRRGDGAELPVVKLTPVVAKDAAPAPVAPVAPVVEEKPVVEEPAEVAGGVTKE